MDDLPTGSSVVTMQIGASSPCEAAGSSCVTPKWNPSNWSDGATHLELALSIGSHWTHNLADGWVCCDRAERVPFLTTLVSLDPINRA